MNNKVIAIALGAVAALFALSLVTRFVLLSQYGVSGVWIFFALPFGGIGVLVNIIVVYIAIQIRGERRQNQEYRSSRGFPGA